MSEMTLQTQNRYAAQGAELRGKILELEAAMKAEPARQIDLPIQHHFAPGIYLREMAMPATATVVGKIHKTEHYCILAKGRVALISENAREVIEAPAVIHAMPGAKRAIHALEESTWINVHHNPGDERDLEKIDAIFVADTYEELTGPAGQGLIEEGK